MAREERLKFVVKVDLEGHMCGNWLTFPSPVTTEQLSEAATFETVKEAHEAMTACGLLDKPYLLGYEITFKGLCHPNPF